MQGPILQIAGSSFLHSTLKVCGLTFVHPSSDSRSLPWQPSRTIHCQHSVKGSKFWSAGLDTSTPAAVSSFRRVERLPSLDGEAQLVIRASVRVVAIQENVPEELQMEMNSSDDDDDFIAVLEIIKKEDKFRSHKVPKLKAMKLGAKLQHSLVLRVLKHKEVKPSNAWKFFVWAKKQMGLKHNGEAYNTIIVTFLEARKLTSIYYLLEDMHKDGVALTPKTCVRMAKTFGSAGMVERAIHALNHMTRIGSPTTTHHLTLVAKLLKSQHHYKAYIASREMAKSGCEPDHHTFKLLLRQLAKVGKVELACHIFDDMQTRCCKPDAETSSILVDILCQSRRIDDAIAVFEEVKQTRIKFNAKVYSHLLDGLVEAGRVEKALEILEEMHSHEYRPVQDAMPIADQGYPAAACAGWHLVTLCCNESPHHPSGEG